MTLTDICEELKNWFDRDEYGRYYGVISGTFEVVDGAIDLSDFLLDGQYYRITGSVFNGGVHKYGDHDLQPETISGKVYALVIPKTVLDVLDEISEWQEKYGDAAQSPFSSESFGGYAVTYNVSSENGVSGGGWQSVFASRLNKWRKI